jgi:hypothetical protein
MIRDRMAKIRRELDQVKRTRSLHRDRRQRAPWPVIALVGYTNAGKSTLFNRLTGERVFAEDLLFATLDPTMRDIRLPGFDKVILSDTVGFVSDLPTELIAAFRATLEEVREADLLIHVRNIAHPDSEAQREDVDDVLTSLGLAEEGAPPRIRPGTRSTCCRPKSDPGWMKRPRGVMTPFPFQPRRARDSIPFGSECPRSCGMESRFITSGCRPAPASASPGSMPVVKCSNKGLKAISSSWR